MRESRSRASSAPRPGSFHAAGVVPVMLVISSALGLAYLIMECYKIKNFLINGIKGLLFIYIQMIIIISILYMFDMNIYFNTNELMGVNLLSINIEKNTFDISVKPLMSFIIFTISGIYLNYKNRIK